MSNTQQKCMRAKEVSKYLGIGLSTVWHMAKEGKLTPKKLSPKVTVFSIEEIDNLLNNVAVAQMNNKNLNINSNIDSLIVRTSSKATRKSLKSAIDEFCKSAELQRGESYRGDCKYHILFTKMIYKALNIQIPKDAENLRDELDSATLEKIDHLEVTLIKSIYTHIKQATEYHKAYKLIKDVIQSKVLLLSGVQDGN